MLESELCRCSLQARLHQVENARSREMKTHGELVQQLQHELESGRTNEGELRLTTAKLRTDKCRLEAELCAANAKVRQLIDQLDAQRTESVQREEEFKTFREESERRLHAARENNDHLCEEKRQLNFELSETRTRLENAKHESKQLLTKNEEQCLRANTQALEIGKLSVQLASKQQEIEAATVHSQLLLEDLTGSRKHQDSMQGRIQELERGIYRALVTRNRALYWRRKRQETWENQLTSDGVFLAWKSISVQAKLRSAAEVARGNDDIRARLQLIGSEVRKRCLQAKEELTSVRQACVSERARIQSMRDEFCQTELPKLLMMLDNHRKVFENQRGHLQLKLRSQHECTEREQERLKMSCQEAENRVLKMVEALQVQIARQKRQQRAILLTFATKRHLELRRRSFTAWKELYLRSVVCQATHTAMVFQSQQPQVPTLDLSSPIDPKVSKLWEMPAPIRTIPITVPPLQLEKQRFDDCLRSPISGASTPIDAMWRKWRRVDAGVAGRGRKPRTSPNLPS